jgi:uncharacterized damage-inducible protein DinB
MRDLVDLYRHNAWANEQVFGLVLDAEHRFQDADAPGTRDTVKGTLAHLARVEYLYLTMIEGKPRSSVEPYEAYAARDLAWMRQHLRQLSERFIAFIESASPEALARPLEMPVFDFPITARDGLLQVLTHSSQHRAQVLSWLSAQGVATPDLDYVLMLRERQSGS